MPGIGQKRIALIALGSNLPFKGLAGAALLDAAVAALEGEGFSTIARSSVLANPALSPGQPDYVNAVLAAELGALEPQEVLSTLLKVERRFGRERGERWAARTLDLDLLDLDGLVVDLPGLVLPHPRLHERRFVLGPLAEVALQWRHPVLMKTASELQDELDGQRVRGGGGGGGGGGGDPRSISLRDGGGVGGGGGRPDMTEPDPASEVIDGADPAVADYVLELATERIRAQQLSGAALDQRSAQSAATFFAASAFAGALASQQASWPGLVVACALFVGAGAVALLASSSGTQYLPGQPIVWWRKNIKEINIRDAQAYMAKCLQEGIDFNEKENHKRGYLLNASLFLALVGGLLTVAGLAIR